MSAEERDLLLPAEELRLAVAGSGIGTWQWDPTKDELSLDSASLAIFDLAGSSVSKPSLAEAIALVRPSDRSRVRSAIEGAREQPFCDLEYWHHSPSGVRRWISLSGVASGNTDGAWTIVGTCQDVSARRALYDKLYHGQKMEAIGQLTSGISHNFNNILSAILPNLQLLESRVDEDAKRFVRNAQTATERACTLVRELMVVAGRKEAEVHEPVDLGALCQRVVGICGTTFGGWIQFATDIDEEESWVVGNESGLEQVLLNLLLNARDAFDNTNISSPRIWVEVGPCDEHDDLLVLSVRDNGPGMHDEVANKIFDPFFTTKSSGTGLGLSTVYATLSDHNARVQCKSSLGMGAEFEIVFSRFLGEKTSKASDESVTSVGGSELVLVVDDDEAVRSATASLLREAGYQVVEASGMRDALDMAAQHSVAFVVMDVLMPEETGDVVLRALRENQPTLPALFYTGNSEFLRAGERDQVLKKPVRMAELLSAVRRGLDGV